jgi:hypothetical protein
VSQIWALVIGGGALGARRAHIIHELGARAYHLDVFPTLVAEITVDLVRAHLSTRNPGEETVVVICTPVDALEHILRECVLAGVSAVYIDQLPPDCSKMARLREAATGLSVMAGCPVRFAYDLPPYSWALVDMLHTECLRTPDNAFPIALLRDEIDLAYSINGRFTSIQRVVQSGATTVLIYHENMASARIDGQLVSVGRADRRILISAYDDDRAINILHAPITYRPDMSILMYRRELTHFLDCSREQKQQARTLEDAEHVLQWTSRLEEPIDSGTSGGHARHELRGSPPAKQ